MSPENPRSTHASCRSCAPTSRRPATRSTASRTSSVRSLRQPCTASRPCPRCVSPGPRSTTRRERRRRAGRTRGPCSPRSSCWASRSAARTSTLPCRGGGGGAARLGLVAAAGNGPDDGVRALADLRPYAAADAAGPVTWWLASDLGELATGRRLAGDHVLGAGGASITLAQVTMRTPVGRVLDLGRAAASRRCTPRGTRSRSSRPTSPGVRCGSPSSTRPSTACAWTCARIDARPVAGEQFDLVVSNPPFVITPRAAGDGTIPEYEYRDGGRAGDDLVRDLIQGVGDVLAPGGWRRCSGTGSTAGASRGPSGSGRGSRRPGSTAGSSSVRSSIRPSTPRPGSATAARRPSGSPAPGPRPTRRGSTTSRRATSRPWASGSSRSASPSRATGEPAPSGGAHGFGAPAARGHLAASLAAHDWLEARDDAALASSRLSVAPT
ncbi:hypothetical protein NKG05_07820 [Oerskovia sp. M15]